jgi:hypothetical protein
MSAEAWASLAGRWSASDVGGWLTIRNGEREWFAAPWREVVEVRWLPGGGWLHPARITVATAEREFTCPGHEVAAARLRHWRRLAAQARVQAPRWTDFARLVADPAAHGGRRWLCELAWTWPADGVAEVLGPDFAPLPRRLALLAASPEAHGLLAPPPGPDPGWQAGLVTFVYDWLRADPDQPEQPTAALVADRVRLVAERRSGVA